MGRLPNLLRLGSKLVLEILPSIAATVIGGYLLTQLHFSRTSVAPPAAAVAVSQTPTAAEERASIQDVLKARRENPQAPEVVRPKPVTTASLPANAPQPAAESAPEAVERAASRPAVASAPAPRRDTDVPRARPEAAASVYSPAPPPGLPVVPAVPGAPAAAVATATPTAAPNTAPVQTLPTVVVSTPAPAMAPPVVERGPVGSVLSGISVFVGQAANVTGNTVNWVIDLPGKAIEAGGRAIGVTPPPPPARPFS